jgi:hypothetical protein
MSAPNVFDYAAPPRGPVHPLWQGGPLPRAEDLPQCPGVRYATIAPAQPRADGGHAFQHGAHLVRHKGAWLASYAVNLGAENTGGEYVQVRLSNDDGRTWRDHSRLVPPAGVESLSHGVMRVHEGRLHAWLAAFNGYLQGVHTRHFVWAEDGAGWEARGEAIGEGFWPLQEPLVQTNGAWLMAGCVLTEPWRPAVARADAPDAARWRVCRIEYGDTPEAWPESTVLPGAGHVLNLSRHGPTRRLHRALSRDGGEHWTPAEPTDLAFADSKPAAGVLADGRPWLLGTTGAEPVLRRDPLTLALGEPGREGFTRLYVVRPAVLPGGSEVESHPDAALSYPHAVEHDGQLYVAYSNSAGRRGANLNSIELAVVPLAGLAG